MMANSSMMLSFRDEGICSYSNCVSYAHDAIFAATPFVLDALDKVPRREDIPSTICDYGSADGGTLWPLLMTCVDAIKKKHGQDKEVLLYCDDLPTNDFKSIFNLANGGPAESPSFAMQKMGVYTACVGTSFYSRCFPANTIHLALSFTAMHWLSVRPGVFTDALVHLTSKSEVEKNAFQQQAADDWETILLARAHELAPGGQMVIMCVSSDEDGKFHKATGRIVHRILKRLTYHWATMITRGKITQEEFINTNFEMYFRNLDECKAPFKDPDSKVCQAGLEVVSSNIVLVPCHITNLWIQNRKNGQPGNARAHAKHLISTMRVWCDSTFKAGLSPLRTEEDKDRLLDEMYLGLEDDFALAPEDYGIDLTYVCLHIQKSTCNT